MNAIICRTDSIPKVVSLPPVDVGSFFDYLSLVIPNKFFLNPNLRVSQLEDHFNKESTVGIIATHKQIEKIVSFYSTKLNEVPKIVRHEFISYCSGDAGRGEIVNAAKFARYGLLPSNSNKWPLFIGVMKKLIKISPNADEFDMTKIFTKDVEIHPRKGQDTVNPKTLLYDVESITMKAFSSKQAQQLLKTTQYVVQSFDAENKKRDNNIDPAWVHSVRAYEILVKLGVRDVPLLAAVLLHDVPEDIAGFSKLPRGIAGWKEEVKYKMRWKCFEFGFPPKECQQITDLVIGYTKHEVNQDGEPLSKVNRADIAFSQLKCLKSMLGKAADIIDNRLTEDACSPDKYVAHWDATKTFRDKLQSTLKDMVIAKRWWLSFEDHRNIVAAYRALHWINQLDNQFKDLIENGPAKSALPMTTRLLSPQDTEDLSAIPGVNGQQTTPALAFVS